MKSVFTSDAHGDGFLEGTLQALTEHGSIHLRDVEQRLDGAAQVHHGEDAKKNLTMQLHEREGRCKRQQSHGRQIVHHDDAKDDNHHFKGPLLHRVHDFFPCDALPEDPDDGEVAEHHDEEGREDDSTEDLIHAHDS